MNLNLCTFTSPYSHVESNTINSGIEIESAFCFVSSGICLSNLRVCLVISVITGWSYDYCFHFLGFDNTLDTTEFKRQYAFNLFQFEMIFTLYDLDHHFRLQPLPKRFPSTFLFHTAQKEQVTNPTVVPV